MKTGSEKVPNYDPFLLVLTAIELAVGQKKLVPERHQLLAGLELRTLWAGAWVIVPKTSRNVVVKIKIGFV